MILAEQGRFFSADALLDTLYGTEEIQAPNCEPYQIPEIPVNVRGSLEISELNLEVCEVVPSRKANGWKDRFKNQDLRPKLKDGKGVTYLLDTGSMCCAWPASQSDQIDPNIILKTVNGSKFDCNGTKKIHITKMS